MPLLHARWPTLQQLLPGPKTDRWLEGERFVEAFRHGSMSVEWYAPIGTDPQSPHAQDELYFVQSGHAIFDHDGERRAVSAGDCLFVAAGVPHRFLDFSADFGTWVVFWGPHGGESDLKEGC